MHLFIFIFYLCGGDDDDIKSKPSFCSLLDWGRIFSTAFFCYKVACCLASWGCMYVMYALCIYFHFHITMIFSFGSYGIDGFVFLSNCRVAFGWWLALMSVVLVLVLSGMVARLLLRLLYQGASHNKYLRPKIRVSYPPYRTHQHFPRLQLRRDIRELALLQLRLPEYRVHVVEAVVHPSLFLDMVQVDKTTRVRVTVHGSKDTSAAELKGLLLGQVVVVVGVKHTICEGLTGSDTEQVSGESGAV